MKKTIITLTAFALLALAPRPAVALGDKEAAIIGGLIGGVIIGAVIDDALDHRDRDRYVSVRAHSGHDSRYDRDYGRDYGRSYGPSNHRSSGYWTYRSVKVWIPKRYVYTRDYCGRTVKTYERGHYEYRREKVWVSTRRGW